MMRTGNDWVGKAAIGAGIAFAVVGLSAAAFMNGEDGSAHLHIERHQLVPAEAPPAPEAPAIAEFEERELVGLAGLQSRLEEALMETAEVEIVAALENTEFEIRIDGEQLTEADAERIREKAVEMQVKVVELRKRAAESRAEGHDARAAILESAAEAVERAAERMAEVRAN